jgi:hypothetical protein
MTTAESAARSVEFEPFLCARARVSIVFSVANRVFVSLTFNACLASPQTSKQLSCTCTSIGSFTPRVVERVRVRQSCQEPLAASYTSLPVDECSRFTIHLSNYSSTGNSIGSVHFGSRWIYRYLDERPRTINSCVKVQRFNFPMTHETLVSSNSLERNTFLLCCNSCAVRVAMNYQEPSPFHICPVGQLQCPSRSSLVHGGTHTNFGRDSTLPAGDTITLNAALAMSRSNSIETHGPVEHLPATTNRARSAQRRRRQVSTLAEILNEALVIATTDTDSL